MVTEHTGYLAGQCLVAMPSMTDPNFDHTVIYVCAHSEEGALGLVLNRVMEELKFRELMTQLGLPCPDFCDEIMVHFGGPVESGRGFVLHSADYQHQSSLRVNNEILLTATIDVLRDIAGGRGPSRTLMALGYAGWSPGQLDSEVKNNFWLTVPPDEELIFGRELSKKWDLAFQRLGVSASMLSERAGHA